MPPGLDHRRRVNAGAGTERIVAEHRVVHGDLSLDGATHQLAQLGQHRAPVHVQLGGEHAGGHGLLRGQQVHQVYGELGIRGVGLQAAPLLQVAHPPAQGGGREVLLLGELALCEATGAVPLHDLDPFGTRT